MFNFNRKTNTIFVMLVFLVFTISVLLVLMFSASVYRNVSDSVRENYNERTALSYIWTKVRRFDEPGSILIGEFNGKSALFINETLGGNMFQTVLYTYDGWLRELFGSAGMSFRSADGLPLLELDHLEFTQLYGGIISVTSGDMNLLISQRSQVRIPRGDDAS